MRREACLSRRARRGAGAACSAMKSLSLCEEEEDLERRSLNPAPSFCQSLS